MPRRPSDSQDLHALFNPRAVAVLGVSEEVAKHSRMTFRQAKANPFKGGIYPINPRLKEVEGVTCYPNPASLPEQCDLVFMAIPAEATLQALRDCAAAGVKVAIVGSAGYAESGPEGVERQKQLTKLVDEYGIRIVGPNCNGIYNAHTGLSVGFNTAHSRRLPAGDIAIVSHSGALFDVVAMQLAEIGAGISVFVSCGNEADFDVLDYFEYVLEQRETNVVALLLDAIPDAARFRLLARRAHELNKHIVALKVGFTDAGAEAANAHSSRLASPVGAYGALFEACGVSQVDSLEGLAAAAALLSFYGKVDGGLAAISASGFGAALLADLTGRYGVSLTRYQDSTMAEVAPHRLFFRIGNPTDFGAFAGMKRSQDTFAVLAADPGVGMVLVQTHAMQTWQANPRMRAVIRARAASGKPVIVLAPGGVLPEQKALLEQGDVRIFRNSHGTVQGVAAMFTPAGDWAEPVSTAGPASADFATLLQGDRVWSEPESLSLLDRFGIPTVPTTVCASLEQVIAAAEKFGWPVVLKAVVPGLAHRSDAGMVRVDIRDADALTKAYIEFASPAVVAVQPFVRGKLEAIAGISRAADVGTILLVGLGGIYTEALKEVAMWAVPASRERIERKLAASALGRVLSSQRWSNPDSFERLVDILCKLQNLAQWAGDRLEACDINPLIIGDAGVIAVDALVVPKTNTAGAAEDSALSARS